MERLGSLGLILEDETGKLELMKYEFGFEHIGVFLVCDLNTKVVYYSQRSGSSQLNTTYMCPYLSENGKYCRFVDGKIVEIE